jgi:hypothetical protein
MVRTRLCLAMLGVLAAGAVQVNVPVPRLALDLRGLAGSEVVYHPYRWLTIRRSIAPLRAEPVDDIVRSETLAARRPRAYALTGDVHPFGDVFRISLGLREDDNRRLLRGSNDRSDIGTARYAPMATVGLAGEVSPGVAIGADMGIIGRGKSRADGSVLITPADRLGGQRSDAKGYRPVIQIAMAYRY